MQALKHQLLSRLSQNFRPEIVYVLLVGKFDQIREAFKNVLADFVR